MGKPRKGKTGLKTGLQENTINQNFQGDLSLHLHLQHHLSWKLQTWRPPIQKIRSFLKFSPPFSLIASHLCLPQQFLLNNKHPAYQRFCWSQQASAASNDLKTSLLEKYSSARNNIVKTSRFITNNKGAGGNSEELLEKKPSVYNSGVPRGAKANVFKKYAGDKFSQADFERQILGVSTVTELSVRSMICVKGRCFNADDMGQMLS